MVDIPEQFRHGGINSFLQKLMGGFLLKGERCVTGFQIHPQQRSQEHFQVKMSSQDGILNELNAKLLLVCYCSNENKKL